MKRHYKPMLAKSVDEPFNSENWIFEIKWDGIRAISYVNGELNIRSRNDKELCHNFPELEELADLAENVVLDGEIVVMAGGKADFQALIERSNAASRRDIEHGALVYPATYVVFDILEKDGKAVTEMPLIERKKLLKASLREGRRVTLSVFVENNGEPYYKAAIERGVEGVMAKRKGSTYQPGKRSGDWLKIKKLLTCDCVIFGYTQGEGSRRKTFGALILGLYDDNKPIFVGKVGTGFSDKTLGELMKRFAKFETKEKTINAKEVTEKVTWLKPELVCEVIYQNATRGNRLRAPRFRSLRVDKKPKECTIDQIKSADLNEYISKRDFAVTPEPEGTTSVDSEKREKAFVVQEHHSRRLHYDLRLEKEGVLKSWAVPKGIPVEQGDKRLAVETEDHPFEYRKFEGRIPAGEYGAGTVAIWDSGSYEVKVWEDNKIKFSLKGGKLRGNYVLARFKKAGEKQWLLLKTRD
jgi:bifunctional non-homologous end joining protein LigD